MALMKYDKILLDIKTKIESGIYAFQELIPSETLLTGQYQCSRNTVRRAITQLAEKGYVQSMHGKGVRVIYQPSKQSAYSLDRIESFKETTSREEGKITTAVLLFTELLVDDKISLRTTFPIGTEIYYIQRIRHFDEKALIIDHNYFRKDVVADLSKEIAQGSIYEYLEETLHINIVTTKRTVTVERITELDEIHLELNDANCVAVVSNFTYNDEGIMFEYTQSRHCVDHFIFHDHAHRVKQNRSADYF